LLQEVGRRLAHCIREQDTVARLGGDEFVVLLVHVADNLESATDLARQVAERILHDLARPYVMSLDEQGNAARKIEHLCSASLGMTLFPPCESDSETILRRADRAMYQAKGEGETKSAWRKSISRGRRWAAQPVSVRSVGWLGNRILLPSESHPA
jgi:diguanylate cyclase (GGDEF)-like protein